jgi:hypothetical protein
MKKRKKQSKIRERKKMKEKTIGKKGEGAAYFI